MPRYIACLLTLALLLSSNPFAQQNATVQGAVVDEQRGVMPGATVTATEVATGRQSVAVTSVEGRYRLENLAPGQYSIRIEMPGFATAEIGGIELLVGSNATVPPVAMKLAGVEEAITVSAQTPMVDVRSSQVAGNIDRRQMAELPLQGRNWQELSLMVKGVTANNIGNTPGALRRSVPAQSRRPADHAARRRIGFRSAQGQPRGDRRVPDRDQHVRHHPGALHRDAGAGDLALRHQRSQGGRLRLLPQRQVQRARPGGEQGAAVPEPAGRRHAERADPARPGAFLRLVRIRTAAGHGVPGAGAAAEPDLRVPDQGREQELSGPRGHAVSPAPTPSPSAASAGSSRTRSRSRAARRTRPPPSSCGSTRPTSSAPGRTSSATT